MPTRCLPRTPAAALKYSTAVAFHWFNVMSKSQAKNTGASGMPISSSFFLAAWASSRPPAAPRMASGLSAPPYCHTVAIRRPAARYSSTLALVSGLAFIHDSRGGLI